MLSREVTVGLKILCYWLYLRVLDDNWMVYVDANLQNILVFSACESGTS